MLPNIISMLMANAPVATSSESASPTAAGAISSFKQAFSDATAAAQTDMLPLQIAPDLKPSSSSSLSSSSDSPRTRAKKSDDDQDENQQPQQTQGNDASTQTQTAPVTAPVQPQQTPAQTSTAASCGTGTQTDATDATAKAGSVDAKPVAIPAAPVPPADGLLAATVLDPNATLANATQQPTPGTTDQDATAAVAESVAPAKANDFISSATLPGVPQASQPQQQTAATPSTDQTADAPAVKLDQVAQAQPAAQINPTADPQPSAQSQPVPAQSQPAIQQQAAAAQAAAAQPLPVAADAQAQQAQPATADVQAQPVAADAQAQPAQPAAATQDATAVASSAATQSQATDDGTTAKAVSATAATSAAQDAQSSANSIGKLNPTARKSDAEVTGKAKVENTPMAKGKTEPATQSQSKSKDENFGEKSDSGTNAKEYGVSAPAAQPAANSDAQAVGKDGQFAAAVTHASSSQSTDDSKSTPADKTTSLHTTDVSSAAHTASDDVSTQAAAAINTAHLIQRMSESELRVGLHTSEFGNIGIRTSLGRDQLSAQITVERGDLSKISEQLPALTEKLSRDHGVNTEINIQDHSAGFSGSLDQRSREQQQQQYGQQQTSFGSLFGETAEGPVRSAIAAVTAAQQTTATADARLDVMV